MSAQRIAVALGILVLAVVGVVIVLTFFNARDDSTIGGADGPGVARAAGADPEVKPGNVILLFSDERLTADVKDLAVQTGGEPTAALVSAGQAVIVRRQTGVRVPVRAVTSSRALDADGPQDPNLRAFIEFWLGRTPGA